MRLAAVPPGKGDITQMVRNYIVFCQKYDVDIHLSSEVNEKMIKELAPDVLVIATGAKPLIPCIEGIENCLNAIDVLDGKVQCGEKTLVIGGGLVGCETADYLGQRGFDVTLVEAKDDIAEDIISEHRIYLMKNFVENQVEVFTSSPVLKVNKNSAVINRNDSQVELKGFDSIVLALGSKAYQPFNKQFANEQYVIGDAKDARRAIDALKEAREIIVKI